MTELNISIENLYIYILVFVRLAGMIFLNPVLSKKNIHASVKTGIVFGATVILTPLIPVPAGFESDELWLVSGIIREVAVGCLLGYVFNIFYYFLIFAGDVLDMQFGFSMARVLDPGSGIQTAFSSKLFDIFFTAYFFVTKTHLVLIRTAVYSYSLIPAGASDISIEAAAGFGIEVFSAAFSIVIKLLFPLVVLEFVLETGMGILMKMIPQINIFVVNLQLKIILAVVLLFLLAVPVTSFIEKYIWSVTDSIQKALSVLVS